MQNVFVLLVITKSLQMFLSLALAQDKNITDAFVLSLS